MDHTTTPSEDTRPLVGIAVGSVLAVLTVVMTLWDMGQSMQGPPAGPAGEILRLFPELMGVKMLMAPIGILLACALIVGIILAAMRHPSGNKVVRLTTWTIIVFGILYVAINYLVVSGSPNWVRIGASMQTAFTYSFIGSTAFTVLIWSAILYLFRKSRWG